jgi:NAD(P)H dehydrogenase (quinone)
VILVTGAGGKTGRAVLGALRRAGSPARAFVHRAETRAAVMEAGAGEAMVGDLTRPTDLEAALDSVTSVYLLCPNVSPDELDMAHAVTEAARRSGVSKLVYHSVLHPQTEAMPHHWQKLRVEEHLFQSGLDVTILQPAAYMQNLRAYWASITEEGAYRVPYPVETRLSLVDLDDVAAAAAIVLTNGDHQGATYELCGPQPLTQSQVAEALSRALGRQVVARAQTAEDWLGQPVARAMPDYQRQTLAAMFRYYAANGLVGNPNVLTWLLGRPPASLANVLKRGALIQD